MISRRALPLVALILWAPGARAAIPDDVVVMAKRIDDFVSFDPAEAYEFSDIEADANLYDRLLDYDPAHPETIRAALAQSWAVADDGKTYRFVIGDGAHFASGRAVTAEDAAFSLQRAVELDLTPAFVLRQFGFTRENAAQRIRAEDQHTLVLETADKVAPSLVYYVMTSSIASVVDREAALAHQVKDDLGHAWLETHTAGSGPYRLKTWRPGELYVLDAEPDRAANREVIVLDVPEPATQRLLLERGDADYARDLDKDELAAVAKDPAIAFDRAQQTSLTYMALNQRNPILRKPQVIEAMKYLVDYGTIANNLMGGTRIVHQGIIPNGILGGDDAQPFRYDVAKAKALLAAAGLPNGFTTTVDVSANPPWIDIALAIQASFAPAGIHLDLLPGDDKETLTKYRARRHDVYLGLWGSDYPDPHSNAQAFVSDDDLSDNAMLKTPAWRNSWQNSGLEACVDEAERESDIAKREALYRAIGHDVEAEGPYVIMFQTVAIAAHRSSVRGLQLGPGGEHTLYAGITKRAP